VVISLKSSGRFKYYANILSIFFQKAKSSNPADEKIGANVRILDINFYIKIFHPFLDEIRITFVRENLKK